MEQVKNNQRHRVVIALICGTVVYYCVSPLRAGSPVDECNSDDPARVVSGCSAVLERTTDPKQRAIGLVRRGEAYEKRGDLGAAVIDFIAASDADPQNFYARADLDRVSPHAAAKSESDSPIWPWLVEGIDFPRGFDPTVEQGVARPGKVRYSFVAPRTDYRYCRAACFLDTACRSWEYTAPPKPEDGTPRITANCRLLADVPEPARAAGSVSGVVRPDGPITAAPAYAFGDGDAFGVRFDTPVALGPRLPASRLPITGPHQLQPSKPHPLLGFYTADALHRGSIL